MATPNFPRQSSNKIMDAANKHEENGEDDAQVDCDDDFNCEKVSYDNEWSLTEEEDLEATVKAIQDRAEASARAIQRPNVANQQPSVVDFLCNFLLQAGMTETLDCFQSEWYEMVQKGLVDEDQEDVVPDVYTENQRLEWELKTALRERAETRQAASVAAQTLVRIQRARDVHRLHHKRLVQEKNRLIEEMKKLKRQCDSYEPAVKQMKEKYQAALRQVSLVALERDKLLSSHQEVSLCGGDEEDKTGEPGRSCSQ